MSVVTRFAPSPTGSLHVGGVRTALYCLLHARKHGGTFLLRIEDTDQARSTDEAAQGILRDMKWCGLFWDEGPEKDGGNGPYFQSRAIELYSGLVDKLLAEGKAYLAWDTKEELDVARKAAEAKKETFRYKRSRTWTDEEVAQKKAAGQVPVVRLIPPARDVTVNDSILGPVTLAAAELEDIVIRKADGFPTYHFAVVVDDHRMHVTQILRGQEHLLNTHKHVGVAEALGFELPSVGHLPIIQNPQGAKMSKREKAAIARDAAKKANLAELPGLSADELKAFIKKENDRVSTAETIAKALSITLPMIEVMDFRRAGYIPEALLNYLALLGWSPGDDREVMTLQEMIDAFTLERVKHTAARFDPTKLEWMNGEYMKSLPTERLLEVMQQWIDVVDTPLAKATEAQRRALLQMYGPRCATFGAIDRASRFFFERPATYDAKAVDKHIRKADALPLLAKAREALATAEWAPAPIEAALTAAAGEAGMGKIAQPVRIALAGVAVTPELGLTLAFLGREEALARIDACLAALGG